MAMLQWCHLLLPETHNNDWHFSYHHYNDVIMTTMASQITSLTIVYWTVYSDADQRKHQSSASLAFVRGIHRDRWIPRTKSQLRGKCFHLMTSSCFTGTEYTVLLPHCHGRDTGRYGPYRPVSNHNRNKQMANYLLYAYHRNIPYIWHQITL